jgi:hypothetical protein
MARVFQSFVLTNLIYWLLRLLIRLSLSPTRICVVSFYHPDRFRIKSGKPYP